MCAIDTLWNNEYSLYGLMKRSCFSREFGLDGYLMLLMATEVTLASDFTESCSTSILLVFLVTWKRVVSLCVSVSRNLCGKSRKMLQWKIFVLIFL